MSRKEGTKMNTRKSIKFFLIAIAGFFLFLSFPFAGNAMESVKIGVILPLSGPVAPIGKTCRDGMDYAVKEINGSGGIKSMNGAKIELIYSDSTGKPEVGLSEAERLILQKKVSALMGSYQSSVTYTSTEAAERYKTPYLVVISVMPKITDRGLKYAFRPTQKATHQSGAMVKFLHDMGEETGEKVKTVAFIYENTDYGQASATVWKNSCEKYGFKVLLDESYPHAATDLTPVLIKLKRAKPDAILNAAYISDMILLVKGAADLKFECMAWVCSGGGELDPKFIPAVGNLADYISTVTPWQFDLVLAKPWIKEVNEGFKAMTGLDLTTVSAMTYSNIYTMKDALERAGSTDREKIREALANTNITSGRAMILPFERIKFDETGQNPYQRMVVSQFFNKKIRVIFPKEFTPPGIKAVWPMPPWSKR
jgi:branched-chain amino acid transport system substrate-binding protein